MRVLVYPHDLGPGGSQLNAVELAAAVRDLGHEVVVFGEPGPLIVRVEQLGLAFVPAPPASVRPSPARVRALRAVVRERRIDVVHTYEWPPAVDAQLAVLGTRASAICTVMSMSVAPFLPRTMPLVVGTHQIRDTEVERGRTDVWVIEPPVDTVHNAIGAPGVDRPLPVPVESRLQAPLVVIVTRLVEELKLEGVLCAIDVVPTLIPQVQLLIVGDGPAAPAVTEAATVANAAAGREAVVLAGHLPDPRPAYSAATVVLGMGGSALRAMAFGKPVVIQGERGFWETLTSETESYFLRQGWYGVGAAASEGPARLRAALEPLLADHDRRVRLGERGRDLVRTRFSLTAAAERQVGIYDEIRLRRTNPWGSSVTETGRATALFGVHAVRRKVRRHRGQGADDFNRETAVATEDTGDIRHPHEESYR